MSNLGDRLEALSMAASERHRSTATDTDLDRLKARVRRGRTVWRSGVGAVGAVAALGLMWGGASAAGTLSEAAANGVSPSEDPGLYVGGDNNLDSLFRHLKEIADEQAQHGGESTQETHEEPDPEETTSGGHESGGSSGGSSSSSGGESGDITDDPEYQEGYAYGLSTGHDQGYTDGHNGDPKDPSVPDCDEGPTYRAGYEKGWVEGYNAGYAVGQQEYADWQYDQGKAQGDSDGWNSGYNDGYEGEPFDNTPPSVGGHPSYQQGYSDGWSSQYPVGYAVGDADNG